MNAAYHHAWRAAHPEYRQREVERSRRAEHCTAEVTAPRSTPGSASVGPSLVGCAQGRTASSTRAIPCSRRRGIVALGQVRPDRRSVLFRPTFEDAVSEALVAIVAGEDPVPAVRRYLAAERAWLIRTAPLLDHLQLRPAA